MTPARHLVRIDDLCPTMDWDKWALLESWLLAFNVKPILAVIPDNQDPSLMCAPPRTDFWEQVREWQSREWSICLHGYQHRYVNTESGILGRSGKSEFAGLSYEEQFDKLSRGLEIFHREGVRADGWVAPSHSFDWHTVAALSALGIHIISDGLSLAPHRGPFGSIWIPQQTARLAPFPIGVWTACLHLDDFSYPSLHRFKESLSRFAPRIITLNEAAAMAKEDRTPMDQLFNVIYNSFSKLKQQSTPLSHPAL